MKLRQLRKYDELHAKLPGYCVFHIANGLHHAQFTCPGHLSECFEKLLHDSEKEYGYQVLYTKTWLNDKEEFLYYFPEEWRQNRSSITPQQLAKLEYWRTGDS